MNRLVTRNMLIRNLLIHDLQSVHDLLRQLGYDVVDAKLEKRAKNVLLAPSHHALVAITEDTVVGVLHVYERPALERPREAVVQMLVVEEGRRGKGIGKGLMQAAEAWARDRGIGAIVLHTRIDRTEAQAFYAQLGYETAATSNLMRKDLDH